MRRYVSITLLLGALALAACGDATAPGNAPDADRAEILAVLDETGWFDERIGGEESLLTTAEVSAGFNLQLTGASAVLDTVPLMRRWGRRPGRPVSRERLMHLEIGDEITVEADVANTTGTNNVPETFVFVHLFHAARDARHWLRLPMREIEDGTWARTWTARAAGRERIAVDALDAQTFATDSEDDYRASVWGVPYRIRGAGGR